MHTLIVIAVVIVLIAALARLAKYRAPVEREAAADLVAVADVIKADAETAVTDVTKEVEKV